jgi:hypothetical protein
MDTKRQFKLRVESCIATIIDVHRRISIDYDNAELLSEFEQLKEALEELDLNYVSEVDILLLEQATNALLSEFRPIFETGNLGAVYAQRHT